MKSEQPPKAGRPSSLINAKVCKVYLDQATQDIMTALGKGNLSAGIREAAQLVVKFKPKQEKSHDGK